MGMFSDILISCDFDRTLTAPDSTIPGRNLEAIRYFMDNGGAFTVNTGRSLAMSRELLKQVPVNAPLILYNGGAAYDLQKEEFVFCHTIGLDPAQVCAKIRQISDDLIVEIQGVEAHYNYVRDPGWLEFFQANHCPARVIDPGMPIDPFLKLSIYGPLTSSTVSSLFAGSEELAARYDRVERELKAIYGSRLSYARASRWMLDLNAAGANKGVAARELADRLGRKTLVCIGDEWNDLTMMEEADFSYCPADGALADRYETVCNCANGAVADVIFEKIPKIIRKQP